MRRVLVCSVILANACGSGGQAETPDAPLADAPSADAPSADAPSADAPSADAPSADAPRADAPSPDAPSPDAPPPSLTDWLTRDATPLLSSVGVWQWTDQAVPGGQPLGLVEFWGVARLGADQLQGVVLTGWAAWGSNTPTEPTPVAFALLGQQPDGTLRLATEDLVASSASHGAGSVTVVDFNDDSRDDIFLAAHNESPFVPEPSVALLSRPDGTFDVVDVGDSVEDHSANLAVIDGKPAVLATNFALASPSSPNPIYSYDGHGGFSIDASVGAVQAMAVAAGDFLGDGHVELVYGQEGVGPGAGINQWNFLYHFEGGHIVGDPVRLPAPYFDKPAYASFTSQWDPAVKTHTPRIWVDDVNHDGLPDLVVNAMIWSGAVGTQKTTLQILQNRGDLEFTDETDRLDPDWNQDGDEDHTLRMADVDGSGIMTYFVSGDSFCIATDPEDRCQPNYILVNDGSGRLHVAMHAEFANLGRAVSGFVRAHYGEPSYVGSAETVDTPRIIAYQRADGRLNFVAVSPIVAHASGGFVFELALTNVPLAIDLATEYRESLTVRDRNGSHRIRTFAGDDTIYAGNSGGHCDVDGGAGTDTVVYSGNMANYTVTRTATGWTVEDKVGGEGVDTLRNIERLQFADGVID